MKIRCGSFISYQICYLKNMKVEKRKTIDIILYNI